MIALRVHIEDDDKVVNKMDTTYGIKPTTFINEPVSTPPRPLMLNEGALGIQKWTTP
ncbi:MAG: hypothetical protein IIU52_03385 [Bacteroidaceae bacterium]|nr:hypothetical protein [Bacteroidaceae bacterium]MBQ5392858.1 hypothetical protein [Bacteroidaceae bacterium]